MYLQHQLQGFYFHVQRQAALGEYFVAAVEHYPPWVHLQIKGLNLLLHKLN